jgi:hypothetical protein
MLKSCNLTTARPFDDKKVSGHPPAEFQTQALVVTPFALLVGRAPVAP